MTTNEQSLEARARRAYELGRARLALPAIALVVGLAAVSLLCCPAPGITLAIAGVLASASAVFLWRGGPVGRAVWPGLLAGALPFTLPLIAHFTHFCFGGTCLLLPTLCIGGGMLAGLGIGLWLARRSAVSLAAATLITALCGSMGCVLMGGAGVAGMLLGILAGATPVILVARARA